MRSEELPAVMDAGSAVMLTVGAVPPAIVTDVVADAVPPGPVAVAVYVVVAAGRTAWVPPPGGKSYVLPSVPATTTWVAFNAVTVSVLEFPGFIEPGFAAMVTEGAAEPLDDSRLI